MNKTTIGWCSHTINPIRARRFKTRFEGEPQFEIIAGQGHYCEKISQECKNCYASRLQVRFCMPEFQDQIDDKHIDVYLDRNALAKVMKHRRKPSRLFWCDMTDIFGHWVKDEWLDEMFAVMALTPHITHLLLTKRARRMYEYFADEDRRELVEDAGARVAECCYAAGWPLPNVHLGVSAGTKKFFADQVPWLLKTRAAVRFLSAEPLLEDISDSLSECWREHGADRLCDHEDYGLDWIIAGGESGPGARPCQIDWIRTIAGWCKDTGTPLWVKQMGANAFDWCDFDIETLNGGVLPVPMHFKDRKGSDPAEWPEAFPQELPR